MPDSVSRTYEWFKKSFPDVTDKTPAIQLGVMLEEVVEVLTALGLPHSELHLTSTDLMQGLYTDYLNHMLKEDKVRTEVLDGLCDVYVTSIGAGYTMGMDILGAIKEVNRSNWSKFDSNGEPVYNEYGKIAKSKHYSPPELEPYIRYDDV